jgi:hypothetical protein
MVVEPQQRNELIRRPPELVQHFRLYGEFTSAQERAALNLIWFGYIARLSQWGGGGNFLVQMISTCFRYPQRKLVGVSTLWEEPMTATHYISSFQNSKCLRCISFQLGQNSCWIKLNLMAYRKPSIRQ